MVRSLSTVLGMSLGKQLAYEKPQIEVLIYAWEVLLETLFKLLVLGLLAVIFDLSAPVLMVFGIYSLFRTLGGGVHLSTFPRCITVGTLLIIGLAKLSTQPIPNLIFMICFVGTALLSLLCIVMWIPADTEKKRITDPQVRYKQKQKVAVVAFTWAAAILCFNHQGLLIYKQSFTFGALAALFFMTPVGYRLMKAMDNTLDSIMRGGVRE